MTPVSVVVPVKGKIHLTLALLKNLKGQHYETLTVIDNGSPPDEQIRLRAAVEAMGGTVPLRPDVGIHEMWNMGLRSSVGHTAILNNDVLLSRHALRTLAEVLDDNPDLAVVSPHPKHIDQQAEIRLVDQVASDTGLAGYAFMVRADWGYRFPEELLWWFGDNDMIRTAYADGHAAAVVGSCWVEHVDGGSQTGDWGDPLMHSLLMGDRKRFNDKWVPLGWDAV